MDRGEDFLVEHELAALVRRMNALCGGAPQIDLETLERAIRARDRQVDNPFCKDMQIMAIAPRAATSAIGSRARWRRTGCSIQVPAR